MKIVLCSLFFALAELLPSSAAATPSATLNPFLNQMLSCNNALSCLRNLDPLNSVCGTWSEAKECMVNANCPDFVIDSAGVELRERLHQNCSGMATGQVCRNLRELDSCLLDAERKVIGLCDDRWQYFGPCFVETSCPEKVLNEFRVLFEATRMDCSSDRKTISPVAKATTTGPKEPQHRGYHKQDFLHTETEATPVSTTEQPRASVIRINKKKALVYNLKSGTDSNCRIPFNQILILFVFWLVVAPF